MHTTEQREKEERFEDVTQLSEEDLLAVSEKIPYPNLDRYLVLDWAKNLGWSEKVKASEPFTSHHLDHKTIKVDHNNIIFTLVNNHDISNRQDVILSLFENGVIKVTSYNTKKNYPFSFEDLEGTPKLTPFNIKPSHQMIHHDDHFLIKLDNHTISIYYKPFSISINRANTNENLISINQNQTFMVDSHLAIDFTYPTPYLFGLPMRPDHLLLDDTMHDRPLRVYNIDIYKYRLYKPSGIYGNVPVIISHAPKQKSWTGMFWQNCSETYVHIKKMGQKTGTYWLSEAGNFEFYLWVNDSVSQLYQNLSTIIGQGAMPQYFTLGYHQCRWSYDKQSIAEEVIDKFDEHKIPLDSITLDIDHTSNYHYFTWDLTKFPEPLKLQEKLAKDGRKLITIADPHTTINPDAMVTRHGLEDDILVKDKHNKNFVGKCWPGKSYWIDYMNPKAHQVWASMYHKSKYAYSTGIIYGWNDMNEPSCFEEDEGVMPKDNLHTHVTPDGKHHIVEHRLIHNAYGLLNAKATFKGLLERNEDRNDRPHLLTRSFFAGAQKYTTVWTADTLAKWEYLQITMPMILACSIVGLSSCGGDIGGFLGDPSAELAIRWFQVGSFMPFFRGHSSKWCNRREPYTYGSEHREIIKRAILFRYRLLPYWYSVFENYVNTGLPVIRPLWINFPDIDDHTFIKEEYQLMLGDSILFIPVLHEGVKKIPQPLHKGLEKYRWYDLNTLKEFKSNQDTEVGLDTVCALLRGGSIIPTFLIDRDIKCTADLRKCDYELIIAPDHDNNAYGQLYLDDGSSYNYQKVYFVSNDSSNALNPKGEFLRYEFSYTKGTLKCKAIHNKLDLSNKLVSIVILGIHKEPNKILYDDKISQSKVVFAENRVFLTVCVKLGDSFEIFFEC